MNGTLSPNSPLIVFTLSDSSGETAEAVVKAALAQFPEEKVQLYRLARVSHVDELKAIVQDVAQKGGMIAYTLVRLDLRTALENEAMQHGVATMDLLGPLIAKVSLITQISPLSQAGRSHPLDESYYRRIAAIEFAIRFDDGKNPAGLTEADIVLIGVSRTSKTPNCMYLAQHWGLKAANLPLVQGVEPPYELFSLSPSKVIGLTIDSHLLFEIRSTRANVLGLPQGSGYTDPAIIEQEVSSAKGIFRQVGCHIINVSNKAIEEISSEIYLHLRG